MTRKIPPLNPLRVFECTARCGSFTNAAEELYVSQSAVSRQVAALEEYLGIRLFLREQGGVTLTPAGERYYREIGPAFTAIASATERLRKTTATSPLKLRVYATFATKWLMRRLHVFQELHPEIHVRISTAVAPVNFAKDDVDGAIQLGDGSWPGADAEFLFGDEIEPVCSPALEEPTELSRHRLLHSRYRRRDWSDWLTVFGYAVPEEPEPMVFPSSLLTYQAALEGLGIAMGQIPLLQSELESGQLVRPFGQPLRRDLGYYLVMPHGVSPPAKLSYFRDWLMSEIEQAASAPEAVQ